MDTKMTQLIRQLLSRRALRVTLLSLLLAGVSVPARGEKIILDADVGIDDAMAILLAFASPELELIGITTVFGNATIANSTRNARYLVSRLPESETRPVVVRGASVPLVMPPDPPTDFVHGDNGLGNVEYPEPPLQALQDTSAAQFIVDQSRLYPGELTLVPVGRLTNLALALRLDPTLPERIARVVLMGGAFHVSGNVTPVAEANIIGDPHAADLVFSADWPIVAVGLDVTTQVAVNNADLEELKNRNAITGELLYNISQFYLDFYQSVGVKEGFYVHDPSAVLYLTHPQLFDLAEAPVRVATQGIARGQTIPASPQHAKRAGHWQHTPVSRYAVSVESESAREVFLRRLASLKLQP